MYKPSNKIGNAIKNALAPFDKLLLTATPLQNSLLELFGLVSVIDEHIFGDIKSFRSQFSRLETEADFRSLRERLKPICQRTLRRQVLEYIPFTNRIALVEEFIPSDAEQKLYNLVSDYLQRQHLYALPASQRQLITLILRRLLASSTFAIAGTLEGLANKLEKAATAHKPVAEPPEEVAQMQDHYEEKAADYEAHVTKGFTTLRPSSYSIPVGEEPRDFRIPVEDKLMIRGMLFGGFERCLYPVQRFQSDTERRFAVVLENDRDVVKWFKPGRGAFPIGYRGDVVYEPDFVVETRTAKLICEPKMAKDINTQEVQDKTNAAVKWCENATIHEKQVGGKPWAYLLIPHDAVDEAKTIQGLAAAFTRKSPKTAVKA